ncbi:prolipoprotein diacylglyceryl transferase [bacterium]|nr:prolipoprotein diacylglyceryl transferase [bacterium]
MPLFISWNFDPEIVHLPMLAPRWYGLLFALAFYVGYLILRKVWLREKLDEKSLDKLSWYVILATLIGARLGHVLFYGPWWNEVDSAGNVLVEGYFDNPLSILNIREGGLASHGAAIGILIGLFLYLRSAKINKSYLWLVDRLVIVVAIGGAFVRIGNFTNSEIIGKPTDAPFGVVFLHNATSHLNDYLVDDDNSVGMVSYDLEGTSDTLVYQNQVCKKYNLHLQFRGTEDELKRFASFGMGYVFNSSNASYRHTYYNMSQPIDVEKEGDLLQTNLVVYGIPRHPAQLYEALCYLLIFLLLYSLYQRKGTNIQQGLLFGTFLSTVFTARFFIEFIKENQVDFEDNLSLNMGQNLSIPFVLIGLGLIIYSYRRKKEA